jgi:hypothetical protein
MIIRDPWGRRQQIEDALRVLGIVALLLVCLFAPESCS